MTTLSGPSSEPALKYHPDAYRFVDLALRHTQKMLQRSPNTTEEDDDESAHITGEELLEGIRDLACEEFGMLSAAVFRHWGVRATADFGRIVFDFIERGAMRKTERDQLSDFYDVYEFSDVFDRQYSIDLTKTFQD